MERMMNPARKSRTGIMDEQNLSLLSSLLDAKINLKKINDDIELNIRFESSRYPVVSKFLFEKLLDGKAKLTDAPPEINTITNGNENNPNASAGENPKVFSLTERETQVIEEIILGLTNKEIANKLRLCTNTVKNHIKNIYHKTGARNKSDAIRIYLGIWKIN